MGQRMERAHGNFLGDDSCHCLNSLALIKSMMNPLVGFDRLERVKGIEPS
jgi:hypothetical protein